MDKVSLSQTLPSGGSKSIYMHAYHPELIVISDKFGYSGSKKAHKEGSVSWVLSFSDISRNHHSLKYSPGNLGSGLGESLLRPAYMVLDSAQAGGVEEAQQSLEGLHGHMRHCLAYCTGSSHWLEL